MTRKLIDPSIRCEADKIGARWFTTADGTEVLTFSQRDAEWIAKNEPVTQPETPTEETQTLL